MKVLEQGNITCDLTQPPTLLMNADTSQIYLLPVQAYCFDHRSHLTLTRNNELLQQRTIYKHSKQNKDNTTAKVY